MHETVYKYFACANSCRGFVDCFSSVLQGMNRVFILKGGPGTGKSTFMKGIGDHFAVFGETVEYIYCSSDPTSLDGIILRRRRIAVVDGTAPHVLEPTAPGALEEYVNLGVAWEREKLTPYREEILELKSQISREYRELYRLLGEAKEIHDRWEKIYLENLDFANLDRAAENLIDVILKEQVPTGKVGTEVRRFFGALTPEGSVNYIEDLTRGLIQRYFIKGRPGTGKSTLMKKLAASARECGLDVEVYPCSFDPESLDMVILRQLGVCVFDATPPHELFPSRDTDVIVDLYAAAVAPGTDEANSEALSLLATEYGRCVKGAKSHLARIHHLHNALEEYYISAMDFNQIRQMMEDLISEIE